MNIHLTATFQDCS